MGQRRVWVRDLARAARHEYPDAPTDRPRDLARFVAASPLLDAALRGWPAPRALHWYEAPTAMSQARWPVAPLDTTADLRNLLGLTTPDLLWFADRAGLGRTTPSGPLRHYRYAWIPKRGGGARLIEQPKIRLKHMQRVIMREILDHVPVRPAAHGFTKGRSAITYAAGHSGQSVVVHLDLEDFFGSVAAGRVYGIFRQCGYPEPVAHLLTGLTTSSVPIDVVGAGREAWGTAPLDSFRRLTQHLRHPHLPQGAPTSPALANLSAFALDRRLSGLAVASDAGYSRYADDIAFSFTRRRTHQQLDRLIDLVDRLVRDEGFRLNSVKTTVRRASQQQRLAGIVVNDKLNIDRRELDRLKALLHNAARDGASSQNRTGHPHFAEHVLGRIGWVTQVNPSRGERLRRQYESIDWTTGEV